MRQFALGLAAGLLIICGTAAASHVPAAASFSSLPVSVPCLTVNASAVVYALDGSVYGVDPDGQNRCRLTTFINAKEPRLSPGGKRVAFLSGVGSNGYGVGAVNTVRVAGVGAPLSPGTMIRVGPGVHRWLNWSPNGQTLAFIGESGVWVWRVPCRCVRLATHTTGVGATQTTTAWSPDSRYLVSTLAPKPSPPTAAPPWDHLRLSIVDPLTGRRHSIVIHFPAWLRGAGPYQESYPSRVIAWLPDHNLVLGTSGVGVGLQITGIWLASSAGGPARMIVGVQKSPRLVLKYPLLNATQSLVSSDARKLLLDPGNRFWVAPSTGGSGRYINLHIHGSCALAQVVWVTNSQLTYVTVCTRPGPGTSAILARLYGLPLPSGRPKLLATDRSPRQDDLSIAPPTRCIACGAG